MRRREFIAGLGVAAGRAGAAGRADATDRRVVTVAAAIFHLGHGKWFLAKSF